MRVVDGALSVPTLSVGDIATSGGIALGLRGLTLEEIPAAGVPSAISSPPRFTCADRPVECVSDHERSGRLGARLGRFPRALFRLGGAGEVLYLQCLEAFDVNAVNLHSFRSLAHLFGILLVRALEHSVRASKSMKYRSLTGRLSLLDSLLLQRRNAVFGVALAALPLAVLTLDGLHVSPV